MKKSLTTLALAFYCVFNSQLSTAQAQGTAFTYQGQLNDSSRPANGSYDLRFIVFDNSVSGSQHGPTLTNSATAISNGLFSVALDFGAIFTGSNYWLDIGVRTNGNGVFQGLVPRQPFAPTPYAIMATSASNLLGALPATQLSAGTAGISITGSAASVTGSFSGDVTGTQSATTVNAVGGVTAANVASGANAANTATDANTANAIVERDGSGNFSAGSLTLDNTLTLPGGTATINLGSVSLIHEDGVNGNFFVGPGAGNSTLTGFANTSLGHVDLMQDTSGYENTASGDSALAANTSGYNNEANGTSALFHNTVGFENAANGSKTLFSNTSGSDNVATGFQALLFNTNGSDNTANGTQALLNNTSGGKNTALGFQALHNNQTGNSNTAVGWTALFNVTSGGGNVAIGANAGSAIFTGNNNIDICNPGFGDESGVIRIGTAGVHTKAVMLGIFGTTVGGGAPVQVNASGLLGTVTSSRRFKQNIQSMADASDVLLSLKPVTFQYKPDLDPEGTPQFGLIAEDVEKLDPDLVLHDDKHRIYTVRYEAVNAMLLNEFLKEHAKVEQQNTEIQDLKQSVAELKELVHAIAEKK